MVVILALTKCENVLRSQREPGYILSVHCTSMRLPSCVWVYYTPALFLSLGIWNVLTTYLKSGCCGRFLYLIYLIKRVLFYPFALCLQSMMHAYLCPSVCLGLCFRARWSRLPWWSLKDRRSTTRACWSTWRTSSARVASRTRSKPCRAA